MKPKAQIKIVGGMNYKNWQAWRLRYDTEKSKLVAHDAFFDGHNWERNGRNRFLFKTVNGRFFVQVRHGDKEREDELIPLSLDGALTEWEGLPEKECGFWEAFPGTEVKDA
ncbi:MAG: hypothetical protein Unbinned7913contig1002_56 [Prokaryotic dsDNA virus sp.]|jgi:hypothetical protein|nr:MAG: hypothetical protein Unbinned7913contig1002_56 [Prokaryotic dsDNA virus sp.]|tara:strand:- start:331 stop:663 length:333 start_codon:yes stop_codon:yes gene_type:complete